MRLLLLLPITALSLLLTACKNDDLLSRLSPGLKEVEHKQQETRHTLDSLGTPSMGQTVPQHLGFMTLPTFGFTDQKDEPPPTLRWVHVDLLESQAIDQIALIPAQTEWFAGKKPTYKFPERFQVDISDDPNFQPATLVASFLGENFPDPGVIPVVFPVHGKKARYVRVSVKSPEIFALAELMVIQGNRNIALNRPATSPYSAGSPPRWSSEYLTDGRTPLGPPILRESVPYDGLYAGKPINDLSVWMSIDLGSEFSIQEVRLHPVHGSFGVDLPGYLFPSFFKVEVANDPEFKSPQIIFETQKEFPNPGNNVVTIPGFGTKGRYVRIILTAPVTSSNQWRFALSEIQVYSGDVNVARKGTVDSIKDTNTARDAWPKSLIVDGCTSYGRILELPEWLNNWTQRRDLERELEELAIKHSVLMSEARRRLWWLLGGLGGLFIFGVGGVAFNANRIRKRDLQRFRRKLAQDLHDEIGSNLAAIGVYSEAAAGYAVPAGPDYWWKIYNIAHEATDAMRETLWLAGGSEESGIDLMKHLQLSATRMLPSCKVRWLSVVEDFPEKWAGSARREVFLFFKETLANVVRHSRATEVDLSAKMDGTWFELEIRDNGRGFSNDKPSRGIGLYSLQERAKRLKGTVRIETAPGKGTDILLRINLGHSAPKS